MDELNIKPIAYIRTDFSQKFGIPRQSGRVDSLRGRIVFLPEYRKSEALRCLEGFSHIWLIFDFSLSHRQEWSPTVRPPRLGGNRRVGVFASRSPFRPNPLGLSCVELLSIEHDKNDGDVLIVGGADLLDMTPIFDIKPYLPSDRVDNLICGYAEKELNHRLYVSIPEEIQELFPEEKLNALSSCLADDPRPSYQTDSQRVYSMCFWEYDLKFKVENDTLTVVSAYKIDDKKNLC